MAKIIHLVGTSVSGKTTVSGNLNELLQEEGYRVVQLAEPGPLREFAKEYRLRDDKDPLVETSIFSVDRLLLYSQEVFPRIDEEGLIFLFARGLPDTVVYQGILGGVDIETILKMNSHIPNSDIYLSLIVDGEIGYERALKKERETRESPSNNEMPDAINRLARAYREIGQYFPNTHTIDTSELSIDETTNKCFEKIRGIL